MSDDKHNDWADPAGVDGWTDTRVSTPEPDLRGAPHRPPAVISEPVADVSSDLDAEIAEGKTLALLSHASILFGLPMFLIPMMTRDNRFALHHAKAAAVTFGAFWVAAVLTVVSCGLFFPFMMLIYIPALVGCVQAANGKLAGSWGFGNVGESLFKSLTVKTDE